MSRVSLCVVELEQSPIAIINRLSARPTKTSLCVCRDQASVSVETIKTVCTGERSCHTVSKEEIQPDTLTLFHKPRM